MTRTALRTLALLSVASIVSCGGSGADDDRETIELTDSQSPTDVSSTDMVADSSDEEQVSDSDIVSGQQGVDDVDSQSSNSTETQSTPTGDIDGSSEASSGDSVDSTDAVGTADPATATEVEDSTSDVSANTEVELSVDTPAEPMNDQLTEAVIGNSNQIPLCTIAGERILSSVEIGMSQEQVLALVGRPLDAGSSGDRWDYGRLGDPGVNFQPLFLDGALQNGPVSAFNSDTSRCDYFEAEKDGPLIEAANGFAQSGIDTDFTNEVPTCFDAGVRISAIVKQGMTPDEVRAAVGKPIEIRGLGDRWEYGDGTFTPQVQFGVTIQNGVVVPTVVQGWGGDIRGCD